MSVVSGTVYCTNDLMVRRRLLSNVFYSSKKKLSWFFSSDKSVVDWISSVLMDPP